SQVAWWSNRLAPPKALVGPWANSWASASTAARNSVSGTTRVTIPHSAASRAVSTRLVKYSSIARRRPTRRGKKYDDDPSGVAAIFEYAIVNLADSAASTRSPHSANENPPPAATPLTAMMTGFSLRSEEHTSELQSP